MSASNNNTRDSRPVDQTGFVPVSKEPLSAAGPTLLNDLLERALDLQNRRRFDDALACYRQVIEKAPEMVAAYCNMGLIHLERNAWQQSIARFRKALDLRPDNPEAAFYLATALKACGQFDKAVQIYQMSLDIKPDQAEALYQQGICYLNLSAAHRASDALRRAVALAPANTLYWFHLAAANLALQDVDTAITCYRKAIELKPGWAPAHFNLAIAYRLAERIDAAIDHLKQALEADPEFKKAWPFLFRLAQHACDWTLAAVASKRLDQITHDELNRSLKTTEPPMTNIRRRADPGLNLKVAQSWSAPILHQASAAAPRFGHHRAHPGRIRLGYLSGDFKDHAVAHQIRGLLEHHDRERFEIFGYACNPDNGTPYRRKLAEACDHFRDVHADSNLSIADRIHADGINILVEMSGHSRDNRLGIAALRPAPVQVNYLGFLSTTGATFIDYTIADPVVVPEEDAVFFTEKLAHLPHCYQANDDTMPIGPQKFHRHHWDLPDQAFVYCSFNQPYKIDAALFHQWMEILKQVDQSVLWLVQRSPLARSNLQRAAAQANVDPARLVFAGFVPLEQNLARLQLADLALDTLIYNGGATTSNALWAGVPVLTTLGTHWVSRMSASALNALGLPELIARDPQDYGRKAVELAQHPSKLQALKQQLQRKRSSAALFDTALFTHHIEKAFTHMWHRHVNGLKPASFKVQP